MKYDIGLEPILWEENPRYDYGRAQGQINPDVRDCDVFVGILYRRWGTPTGTFSSGFEEEFLIAEERFLRGEPIMILIYFKDPIEKRKPAEKRVKKPLDSQEKTVARFRPGKALKEAVA